jgi:autotransporter-associated beta strand protein
MIFHHKLTAKPSQREMIARTFICVVRSFASGVALLVALLTGQFACANIPGGGTGTGANVTVTDNNDGSVTMANGVVSIHIIKNGASINQINYTYNNGGGTQTQNLLAGGKNGGTFYWEFGGWGGNPWVYSLVTNSGSYAEVDMYSDSATNGLVDIHFSMLRGSPGFYATPIWSHRPQDTAFGTGEERDNIYIAPYFNWMSVNDQVQRETGLNATYAPAFYSPQENSLATSGVLQGTYDDKYKWSADFSVERVWGWSSVSDPAIGLTGNNVGIWHVISSWEFYNGGPLKPELNDAPMVNMINGGHYYFGNDSGFAQGESWTRVSGPYFIYLNNVTNTLTDPVQTSQALYADAKAQAAAEATAWPYNWFGNTNYASASQRGTVTGQIVINDIYNPNASASNLWVGVEQQPNTTDGVYDFQLWMKPYEFWVRTDANGNFTIPNVIAGNNYTLYAFGPGAAGTFMSQNQNGGNPNLVYNLASPQFSVTVTGGTTNNLGTKIWTPSRVAPTVFEIGYPDRKGDKFRHGDDYWVGDVGPSPTAPSPVWTKFIDFPFDFPNGLNYTVGQNRWNTDWNFIQSVYPDYNANNIVSSSTVTFNLVAAPPGGTMASLYLGIASDDNSPIYVTVNGTLLYSANTTGIPQTSLPNSGWFPEQDISDSNIREENHGGFSDERLTFPASLLNTNGVNTINFSFRQAGGSGFTHHFIYDYIRLELPGYVPPAPASVTAYSGNNSILLSWPTVPGATSYNILRSTTSGSGYVSVTNGVVGPVCGSGPNNATYVDSTAVNGTSYYYVVQSVNPVNHSGNSPQSSGVVPSAGISSSAPATPAGLIVTSTNNAVSLSWSAVPGANFYTVQRGTVVNRLGYVPLYTTLNNITTGTAYTDSSGTLGCTYSYIVSATSAGGSSTNSLAVTGKPVPPPPATAPANVRLNDTITSANQTVQVTWSPVSGAVGYILYRANNPAGPFSFPGNYLQSMMTTNYTDGGLATNTLYSYMVIAMNAGGISGNSTVVSTPPAAPASLNAFPANSQITLAWAASVGATNYVVKRGTSSGNETITIVTTTNVTYTDTNLVNGTTYYYIVTALGSGGSSLNSIEASATPSLTAGLPLVWSGAVNANWNINTTANWVSNGIASVYADGSAVQFDDTAGGSTSLAVSATVTPASMLANNSSKTYAISGSAIAGNGTLTKSGSGALTLAAANTFSGAITINNGTLIAATTVGAVAGTSGPLGNCATPGRTLTINSPGVLDLAINNVMGQLGSNKDSNPAAIVINGGTVKCEKPSDLIGALTLNGGTVFANATSANLNYHTTSYLNSYLSFQLGGNVSVIGSSPSFITNSQPDFTTAQDGASLLNGPTIFTVADVTGDALEDLTITAALGDVNSDYSAGTKVGAVLVKAGAGTLLLSGLNFYSGGTIVSAGTLEAGTTDNQPLPAATSFAGAANAAGAFGKPGTTITLGDTNTTLNNYSASLLIGGAFVVGHPIIISTNATTGTYTIGGSTDDNAAFTNLITLNQPLTISEVTNAGANVLTISGGIAGGNPGSKTITFGGPGNVKVTAAPIADGGGTLAVNVTGGFTTFNSANTYSGGTLVSNGILEVDNLSGSGTSSGPVVVQNGGTLAGSGIISGAVTVQNGGAFESGSAIGRLGVLTLNSSLTLAAGSTTFVQVQHAPLTNDVVKISGALTEGGTLAVANFGATIFAAGDRFKLFNAASYTGSFTAFVLPDLTTNLAWNTSQLNADGSLWVVGTMPPNISQITWSGSNFFLSGTGGTPNWNYYVLTTTNLNLPVAQWTRIATNQFDAGGNFISTNALTANLTQNFFRLQVP